MSKSLTLLPVLNEKTYGLSKSKNVFVFQVPLAASKQMVIQAVKSQFEVDALSVNTIVTKGKMKRIMSLNGRRSINAEGRRPNVKKAYVTLKEGQSLPFFEAIEEDEEKRANTQEKLDKAAQKQSEKEAKSQNTDNSAKRRFLRTKKAEDK